ncbi:hypothetical protein KZX46_21915 (plasmid) [Polymorphobacter sp. PAMC 29334]|uniref:hypothetical protein n=1 Tax=Polymorphobacter sp. PAMC 29334 TaxID=2862331 RepID=UPI001C75B0B1|nr:hypothetical protein [Polymorphobacter sp. PAMC 29334]QYE37058.1 hypothetical protein KZX46_21915 [Polymorphobacter sp. PAMC 29334]
MTTAFMNVTHCARMATRQALRTGEVVHVIATGNDTMPIMVIDEHQLFAHGDRLGPEDLLFTADPFGDPMTMPRAS